MCTFAYNFSGEKSQVNVKKNFDKHLKIFRVSASVIGAKGNSRYYEKGCMAMRNTNRQPTLKRTYYRSFLLMVVIPLVLVFVCAEVVVSYIIRNSAIETIDALQDNFTNPELMLKTVADFVGFSEKYFSSRFTQECGCTFIGYLNDLRIGRAQEPLLQTDMKIYEISDAVGYSSVEHFNHMFKKKLCMSPKDFRKTRD